MRLDDSRESSNVEDRRGSGPMIGGGIGIGTIVLALVGMYFGIDPSVILNMAQQGPATQQQAPVRATPANDPQTRFVAKVLGETEDTWSAIFQEQAGHVYQNPKLVLFSGQTPTACGTGETAAGPFYCPNDRKVYLDLAFFADMQRKLGAPGDFAQAYVIAHEVGHHVQNQLGTFERFEASRRQATPAQANKLSVRIELQADCYAGIWAKRTDASHKILEQGDIEEAINAAAAVGDDRLQSRGQGYVVPDSFTHGSSAQRVKWFKRGFDSGTLRQCDTFLARDL